MKDPLVSKLVCIHGHFYQPPRGNPWLDAMEKEDSASPYHDWNERINFECYRANTGARLVDRHNRILALHNNYGSLSFNFGPTLLNWLERHDPWVYESIIEADRESCERFGGHGNAMAQAFTHLIMPLASRRDKETQAIWGIRDFKHRFGRFPEGMWLPETAVDTETLEVLAEAGIKFTILSPFQAARWRFADPGSPWRDAGGGSIPTGRAYRYRCKNGKSIVLFFYDPSLAKGIAFEGLLGHSSRLLSHIQSCYENRDRTKAEPWLIHSATDGESYGHHFKFGDMALAAAFVELDQDPSSQVVNYGAFLDSFPVIAEAEIIENTAWSCAHGLGRWMSDCGCHIGGEPGWSQTWRAPLREALNRLRDSLANHFEREMGLLAGDPWSVRDEYVDVLLDPSGRAAEFAHRHMKSPTGDQLSRFFQLLEMQRNALFMFTSCGWFFDEVSGLETILVLRFAARAIQLAEQTGCPPLEPDFLAEIEKAPSNLPRYGNGAEVYRQEVKPCVVTKDRAAANYAIQSLARASHRKYNIYSYDIVPLGEEDLGPNPAPCLYGHIRVEDSRTLEQEEYLYAVIHFEGLDFRCSVRPFANQGEYDSILKALQQSVEEQNTVKMVRILDDAFGDAFYSLHDVFRDLRSSLALEIGQNKLTVYTDFQRHSYQMFRPLMSSFRQWGIRIPSDLRVAVRRILSDDIDELVRFLLAREEETPKDERPWDETDFFHRAHTGRLSCILEDAQSWGVALQLSRVGTRLGQVMVETLSHLERTFSLVDAGKLYRMVNICRQLKLHPETWKLQTLYYQLVRTAMKDTSRLRRIPNFGGFLVQLDAYLNCHFSRFFGELTISSPKEIIPLSRRPTNKTNKR